MSFMLFHFANANGIRYFADKTFSLQSAAWYILVCNRDESYDSEDLKRLSQMLKVMLRT